MKLLPHKQKASGNVRRTPKKVSKNKVNWLKPMVQGLAVSVVVAVLVMGGLQLNQKLSVTYWDIEADAHVETQIKAYFAEQKELDFWHTRASVIQDELIERIPDIKRLEVSRILPNGLLVKAKARAPIALWENRTTNESGQVMLIDKDGIAYRVLSRGENLDLPIFRLAQDALGQASILVHQLLKANPSKAHALSEVIVAENEWRLNFAHGEQWQLKEKNLKQDVNKVMEILVQPRWAQGHWRMDARIPQRWFVRPAKQEVI
ncbi:MAG: hypothetical protein R8M46_09080 [Ghiorsea sp.]